MEPIGEASVLMAMMRYSEVPRDLSSESLRYNEVKTE